MESLLQDLRYAWRTFAKRPGFTAAVLVTLALGIGANTALFSVVRAVLLRSLPYPDPDRLVVLWGTRGENHQILVAVPDVLDWRDRTHSFSDIGIVRPQSVNLTGTAEPDRLVGEFVTASTLQLLGARTQRGRLFSPEETTQGSGRAVVLISDDAWRTRFGSDPQILGRTISLNGRPHVVIGVTAPGFRDAVIAADVWLPITSAPNPNWFQRGNPSVWAIGRLKPGVTLEQAGRDLSDVAAGLARELPATNGGLGVSVLSLRDSIVGPVRPALLVLFGFVATVLVIACVNVTNLLLTSTVARRRELSLRAALGAGRFRLVRQLLTESLLLALLGGAAGVLVARWTITALAGTLSDRLPTPGDFGLDPLVLLFATTITALVGLGFGAAPALQAARTSLNDALTLRGASGAGPTLRGGGSRPWGGDARGVFVALQLVLSLVLLAGASLLGRSLLALQTVDPGFAPDHVLTAEFRLPGVKYPTPEAQNHFMATAIERIRAAPGVRSAALIASIPLSGNWGFVGYAPDTRPEQEARTAPVAQANTVSDRAFETLRVPLVAGRDFDTRDRADAPPVAIVNETLARETWPGSSPLGRRLKLFGPPVTWVTVVGVVADVKQRTLRDPPTPQIYLPFAQSPGIFNSVVARTDGDPSTFTKALRAAIWSVDPEQPVWALRPLESYFAGDQSAPRFIAFLTGGFALLALLLAAIGLYGVTAFGVAQRTQEVGVRIALGARAGQVIRLVVGRGLRVAGLSAIVGTGLALGTARLLSSQLYGVSPADPVTFLAVPLGLLGVALLACYFLARRAARVDPVVALRTE